MTKILFVCTGNICRSPTAEAVARHFISTGGLDGLIEVDSAGTHGYHVGEAPDPRTRKAAQLRGYDLSALRARKLDPFDFQRFDLLLAMDRGHLETMRRLCPEVYRPRLGLFMEYARNSEYDEVPDPYYGGPRGFDVVLDMCEDGVKGLLETVTARA
ncbi:low molecular weight protein-tyrosine-phosphatase [Thauera sp. 63]|jgi:protein-tyrosine phosphatase|uniref:low molecular weight protein-tyrosine-phosphatase n=1 Tax=Thauera sp. 63 TaxID=497321 RepID=UPI0002CFC9F1|nr:low molecular weight protein-tyrosine-phosphatase [Thauera sp. 63]ENO78959.1 protein tyrosine phosphatase [Thauera sp. 63]